MAGIRKQQILFRPVPASDLRPENASAGARRPWSSVTAQRDPVDLDHRSPTPCGTPSRKQHQPHGGDGGTARRHAAARNGRLCAGRASRNRTIAYEYPRCITQSVRWCPKAFHRPIARQRQTAGLVDWNIPRLKPPSDQAEGTVHQLYGTGMITIIDISGSEQDTRRHRTRLAW